MLWRKLIFAICFMETRERKIFKVTLAGTLVNAVLIAVKFFAGIVGRSSAMVADAVHSLTDFVTDIIVLVFVKISGRPQDEDHGYGHGKFETLAALVIGLILGFAGIVLMINGVRLVLASLRGEVLPEPTWLALAVALVSIVSKELLFRYTAREGRTLNSDAVMANAWHHRSDAISSLGTLVGIAGAMFLGAQWRILDPLAAVVVSVFIIKAGYDIIRPSIDELLEGSLPPEQLEAIGRLIMSVDGVRAMHRLRTRKVGNAVAIDVHIKMDGAMSLTDAHAIATQVEERLRGRFGSNVMVYIHMEPYKD